MRLHLKTQYMLKGYAVNRNAVSGQKYEDLKKAATSTPTSKRKPQCCLVYCGFRGT